jgi:hypothetical protein
MNGVVQKFELKFGSFGEQVTTIDGQDYLTWFDLADPRLKGFGLGCRVEFEAASGPTILCSQPHMQSPLPSARITRILHG